MFLYKAKNNCCRFHLRALWACFPGLICYIYIIAVNPDPMSPAQIIAILGTIPLFSLRTFLPAFLTALLLAYPECFPGMDGVASMPEDALITRDWVLVTLGILSLLEILGDKSTEIRNLVKNVETYSKPFMYLLINLSLLDDASAEVLKEIEMAAVFDPGWIPLAIGTWIVHWLSSLRRDFITFLEDIDEDDNFYISSISSWIEDSLVIFGFLLLIWTGILMVAIYAAAIGVFLLLRKRYARKLEQQKTTCPACGSKNLPFAVRCYNCKEPQPQVYGIGVFGQKKKETVSNMEQHRLKLLSHRRCSDCGNKMDSTKPIQTCNSCGNHHFKSPTTEEFIRYQDKKFYKITGLSFLLGFIPVVGFIVSAVLANVHLFTPYRRYIPKGRSFVTKIFIKFLTFFFFLLGVALGFIAAPVYIVLRYYIWKNRFVTVTKKALVRTSS